jgi:hypothetical protein
MKKRGHFRLNLPRRASINKFGSETRHVPVTLPKLNFLREITDDDDGKRRTTEASSA